MKKVLIIWLLLASVSAAHGQQKLSVGPLYPLHRGTLQPTFTPFVYATPPFNVNNIPSPMKSPVGPRDYYDQCFGFFCKKEWNFERQTRVALKVRLGSYQEAQRIEGK